MQSKVSQIASQVSPPASSVDVALDLLQGGVRLLVEDRREQTTAILAATPVRPHVVEVVELLCCALWGCRKKGRPTRAGGGAVLACLGGCGSVGRSGAGTKAIQRRIDRRAPSVERTTPHRVRFWSDDIIGKPVPPNRFEITPQTIDPKRPQTNSDPTPIPNGRVTC